MIQILINIIVSFSLILLVAISFSIIYYSAKLFHISHAVTITSSAYIFFILTEIGSYRIPSLIVGVLVATCIGLLCEIVVYCQMRKRNAPVLAYLIVSIGLYVVLQNCISLYFGDETKIINTAEVTVGHQVFGAYITTIQIITICISLVLFTAVNLFIKYTATGRALRAVAGNAELSNVYGISFNKIILIAFGIGSALAAVAGILSAMDTGMTPTFGFNLLLYGVVAMIIGGVGSTKGLLWGSLLVAAAQNLAAYYLDTKWMDAVTYIILIIFLIWKPLGFSGNRLKKTEV